MRQVDTTEVSRTRCRERERDSISEQMAATQEPRTDEEVEVRTTEVRLRGWVRWGVT